MEERSKTARRAGLTERDRFWLRHIEASTRARMPASVYALEHRLSLGALYEARRRLVRRGALSPRDRRECVSFARVEIRAAETGNAGSGPFRLRLSGGAVLEWAAAPGIDVLEALIERLERAR